MPRLGWAGCLFFKRDELMFRRFVNLSKKKTPIEALPIRSSSVHEHIRFWCQAKVALL